MIKKIVAVLVVIAAVMLVCRVGLAAQTVRPMPMTVLADMFKGQEVEICVNYPTSSAHYKGFMSKEQYGFAPAFVKFTVSGKKGIVLYFNPWYIISIRPIE